MGAAILERTKRNAGLGGGEKSGLARRKCAPAGSGPVLPGTVGCQLTLRLPSRDPVVGMALDNMAAACRALEPVWLRASWPALYTGRTGSGSPCYCFPFGAKRYLLTENIVKLEEFQHKKMVIAYNLSDTKEAYFKHLEEKLTQNKLILKEELRKLLYLCQSQDDVEFAKNVIYRYHAENRNFTVGEYKFGPIFMRLCYALDLEESAMALIKDKHLRGFFVESTSFNILMDMLFVKGKYESAVELLFEMQSQDVRFTKDSYILAFAICYKLNTPESLKICTTLREESLSKGNFIPRRASHFAVALALNQNQLEEAMTIFSQISVPESITCTNLNIIIHIQSNMLENLMKILQDAASENSSNFVQKRMFSEEVGDPVSKRPKKKKKRCHIRQPFCCCYFKTYMCECQDYFLPTAWLLKFRGRFPCVLFLFCSLFLLHDNFVPILVFLEHPTPFPHLALSVNDLASCPEEEIETSRRE